MGALLQGLQALGMRKPHVQLAPAPKSHWHAAQRQRCSAGAASPHDFIDAIAREEPAASNGNKFATARTAVPRRRFVARSPSLRRCSCSDARSLGSRIWLPAGRHGRRRSRHLLRRAFWRVRLKALHRQRGSRVGRPQFWQRWLCGQRRRRLERKSARRRLHLLTDLVLQQPQRVPRARRAAPLQAAPRVLEEHAAQGCYLLGRHRRLLSISQRHRQARQFRFKLLYGGTCPPTRRRRGSRLASVLGRVARSPCGTLDACHRNRRRSRMRPLFWGRNPAFVQGGGIKECTVGLLKSASLNLMRKVAPKMGSIK